MKNKKEKNSLRDLIVNNPRAQQRKAMKKIERNIRCVDKNFVSRSKFDYDLWQI